MLIAIDFDGTLCENRWPEIGDPLPGMVDALWTLHHLGHDLALWTCREGESLEAAKRWLSRLGVFTLFCAWNENPQALVDIFGNDCRKVGADLFIDDRCPFAPRPFLWKAALLAIVERSEQLRRARRAQGTA